MHGRKHWLNRRDTVGDSAHDFVLLFLVVDLVWDSRDIVRMFEENLEFVVA
jgi:hypothetical protein